MDKTLLIKELLEKKGDVNLFTRPRRFGKTLNMSMLQHFFEDSRNDKGIKFDNTELFQGLNIMRAGEQYLSHMGQYPVINLSLKSGKQPDFDMAYHMLIRQIAEEYLRHKYILQDGRLSEQKERYLEIMRERADRNSYNDSLKFLSQCLEKYYGQKVIILIDEYDVPLENAFMEGFYEEMVAFIRSLFESALKTNSSLEFAVITGCLRISKESIFTGYFRKVHEWMDGQDKQFVELMIPNKEVKYIFRTKILGWFEEKVKAKDRSNLFQALIDRDVAGVICLSDQLLEENLPMYWNLRWQGLSGEAWGIECERRSIGGTVTTANGIYCRGG